MDSVLLNLRIGSGFMDFMLTMWLLLLGKGWRAVHRAMRNRGLVEIAEYMVIRLLIRYGNVFTWVMMKGL